MANSLIIECTKFTDLASGQETYGFIARDDYREYVENHHTSLESFQLAYPTSQSIEDHVLCQDGFDDIGGAGDGVSAIVVRGYPELPSSEHNANRGRDSSMEP